MTKILIAFFLSKKIPEISFAVTIGVQQYRSVRCIFLLPLEGISMHRLIIISALKEERECITSEFWWGEVPRGGCSLFQLSAGSRVRSWK